jgi:ATPase family associated with various cellular activities (AAA)
MGGGMKNKNINVIVIGDVHYDIFCDDENNNESKPELGGTFFVENILKKKKLKDEINIINGFTTIGDKGSGDICLGPIFNLKWNVREYENFDQQNVFRCEDRLGLKKEFSNKKYVFFNKPELSRIQNEEGISSFFLMECIGDHRNENSSADNRYTSFFSNKTTTDPLIEKINKTNQLLTLAKRAINFPNLFWILHHDFPELLFKSNISKDEGDTPEEIDDELKNRSIIFLNASSLRQHGIYIRQNASWECTAQDYICALYSNSFLKDLRKYRHVITRFGLTGAIYSYRLGKSRWLHRLILDPSAKNTGLFRNVSTEGDVIGYQSIFASCVLNEIVSCVSNGKNPDEVQITEKVCDGIRKAIISCQNVFNFGLGNDIKKCLTVFHQNCGKVFKDHLDSTDWNKICQTRIPVANPAWSILVQSAEYKLFEIAENIVVKGIDSAINHIDPQGTEELNNEIVWAPVLKFGDDESLVIIDRREIESYRVIHGLISRALNEESKKILSIAVFGPPGSGKSFTVGKLIESAHSTEKKCDIKTINMTNIVDKEMLYNEIITSCWNQYQADQVPIIFFDEFDCKLGDEDLGWLKYFLNPMEDFSIDDLITHVVENKIKGIKNILGTIDDTHEKTIRAEGIKIKDNKQMPIFIFAGGTSHNYLDFCHEDSSWTEEQKAHFINSKGPDFVSRLRGHINILGINRVDEYDDGYIIRRAILMRSMLIKRLKIGNPEEYDLVPFLDLSMIKAMLKGSSYKHGARSMRTIIDMIPTIGGQKGKLVGSSLPPLSQLNMHVNGKEFLEQVISDSQLK